MDDKVPPDLEAIADKPIKEVHPAILQLARLLGKSEAQHWMSENAAEKSSAPNMSTAIEGTDAE